jgi:hypothetical protein
VTVLAADVVGHARGEMLTLRLGANAAVVISSISPVAILAIKTARGVRLGGGSALSVLSAFV